MNALFVLGNRARHHAVDAAVRTHALATSKQLHQGRKSAVARVLLGGREVEEHVGLDKGGRWLVIEDELVVGVARDAVDLDLVFKPVRLGLAARADQARPRDLGVLFLAPGHADGSGSART